MKITSENLVKNVTDNGIITEQELKLLLKRLNNGEKIDVSLIWDNHLKLTDEQNKKGFVSLWNHYKTPSGAERKNNPFGYREQEILEDFTDFELIGFYEAGNYGRNYYLPLYSCNGANNSFEYYYNGKVNIVG